MCPYSKLVQIFYRLKARLFIARQILLFHPPIALNVNIIICIFADAHFVNLSFLWLDVKVDRQKTKKQNKTKNILLFIFFYPKTQSRTGLRHF